MRKNTHQSDNPQVQRLNEIIDEAHIQSGYSENLWCKFAIG